MKYHPSQTNDALILQNADHFEISLFLGTGRFAKHEAKTLDEARTAARQLLADHPTCTRRPLIYAVTAEGKALPLSIKTEA